MSDSYFKKKYIIKVMKYIEVEANSKNSAKKGASSILTGLVAGVSSTDYRAELMSGFDIKSIEETKQ